MRSRAERMEDAMPQYDAASLRRHLAELGERTTGTPAELRARLERATTSPGEIAQPIAEGMPSRKLKK